MPSKLHVLALAALASGCYESHRLREPPVIDEPALDAGAPDAGALALEAGLADERLVCGCLNDCPPVPFDAFDPPADAVEAVELLEGHWQWCRGGVGFHTSNGLELAPRDGRVAAEAWSGVDWYTYLDWELAVGEDPRGVLVTMSTPGLEPIVMRPRLSRHERALLLFDASTDRPLAALVPLTIPPVGWARSEREAPGAYTRL